MSAKSGEKCKYTGDFKCQQCGEVVHVEAGLTIPKCPGCGNETFSLRNRPVRDLEE